MVVVLAGRVVVVVPSSGGRVVVVAGGRVVGTVTGASVVDVGGGPTTGAASVGTGGAPSLMTIIWVLRGTSLKKNFDSHIGMRTQPWLAGEAGTDGDPWTA